MNTLLNFILTNLGFLYGKLGFRICNSICTVENGDALLEFEKADIIIQCIRDKGEISIYFNNKAYPNDLFELSEIIEILSGQINNYKAPGTDEIEFLKTRFTEINQSLTLDISRSIQLKNEIRNRILRELGYFKND